jgi:hypothetical protein
MGINTTIADLDRAIELRVAGHSFKECMESTGANHSQIERHEFRFKMLLCDLQVAGLEGWTRIEFSPQAVVEAREAGVSWGAMGERMNVPESRCRKAFRDFTNTYDTGHRIGHGGRFVGDERGAHLYDADRAIGTLVPTSVDRIPELTTKGEVKGIKADERQALNELKATMLERREAAAQRRADRVAKGTASVSS